MILHVDQPEKWGLKAVSFTIRRKQGEDGERA